MKPDQGKKELPLDKKPLRNPGQSLEEQIDKLVWEGAVFWAMMIVGVLLFVFMEWLRWFASDKLQPVIYTALGASFIVFFVFKMRRSLANLDNLKTGLLGERHVGQFLQNAMLRHGYWVVHDIPCDGFNIDHALIGPGGAFAIETKLRRKRKGDARVDYDGQQVAVDGFAPERDPIVQAKAVGNSLHKILLEYSGVEVFVRPVVLFPGWYVNKQPAGVEVWVLNEKGLEAFLLNERTQLSKEDAYKLAAALGRYVRDQNEKRAKG